MAELDNLQIKISADTLKAISAINKLNNSLKKLKDTASSSGAGFKTLAKQTNMFCDAIKGNIRTLERYAAAMQKISNSTNRQAPKAPTKPRKVKQDKVETETGITELPDQQNTIEDGRQGALQHINNLFKKLKANTDKATKSASMFVKVLKRMVLYMALRTAIQGTLKALKDGADLIYKYAQVTENASEKSREFVKTMDAISSNTLKMKVAMGSVSASFAPLKEIFTEKMASILISISDALNYMSSLLQGEESYWKVNTEAVKKYEGALKSLTSQYDELNTLTNANEVDYSTLLEEVALDEKETTYAQALGKAASGELEKTYFQRKREAQATKDSTQATNDNTKSVSDNTSAVSKHNQAVKELKDIYNDNSEFANKLDSKLCALNKSLATQENLISKGLPTAMDILNGTSITTPLQSFQTLNAEIQKSIDLTNQLNGKTTSTAPKSTASAPPSSALKSSVKAGGTLLPGMVSLSEYASGGFVQSGEIFIARESGPEMVGTIGGQGAVANNADIVQAIAQGVADAIARGNMTVSVSSFEGGARSLIRSLDNSATLRRLGGI